MNKRKYFFSIFIGMLIPLLMLGNTLWQQRGFNEVMDKELQYKALSISNAFSTVAVDYFSQANQLELKMNALAEKEPVIREITVYRYVNNTFTAVTSTSVDKQLEVLSDPGSTIAWAEKKPTVQLEKYGSGGERVWSVVNPLFTSQGEAIGIMVTKVSLASKDFLGNKLFYQSLTILVLSILLVLLFLFRHFSLLSDVRFATILREVDRMKGTYIATVSHRLHEPAVRIRNYALVLYKNYDHLLDEQAKSYVQNLATESTKVIVNAKDLAEFSTIEYGSLKLNKQFIDPVSICEEICRELEPIMAIKEVQFIHTPQAMEGSIFSDGDRFKQAISILMNIIVTSTRSGTVGVEYMNNVHRHWAVSFKASDLQLDDVAQVQIFNEHPPVYIEEHEEQNDLNVSIWIARRLILRLGGEIEIHSEPDKGTTIQLAFRQETEPGKAVLIPHQESLI